MKQQSATVPLPTTRMLSLRTKLSMLSFSAHEQSFPYVLNDALLESHFLQEMRNVIVFRMNWLTHTHRVLFRTKWSKNAPVVFLTMRASSGTAEMVTVYLSTLTQHDCSNEELRLLRFLPKKICRKIFIAGLLKSSIRDVLWTKYASEEVENYRTNYTKNIKPNWFIDHSCYNDMIERIDYGNYLHKLFC